MKKIAVLAGISAFIISFISGCASSNRIADVTVISTKNISSLRDAKRMGEYEGEDCVNVFFQMKVPNMEEAIDKALSAGEGNAMLDCVIYYDSTICLGPIKVCYRVKGTVIRTKDIVTESKLRDEIDSRKETGEISEVKTTYYNGNTYVWVKSDKSSPGRDLYESIYRFPTKTIAENKIKQIH